MLRAPRGFMVLLSATTLVVGVAAQHATNASSSPGQLWTALEAGNRRFVSGKLEATTSSASANS
jgi:hypothetical protein